MLLFRNWIVVTRGEFWQMQNQKYSWNGHKPGLCFVFMKAFFTERYLLHYNIKKITLATTHTLNISTKCVWRTEDPGFNAHQKLGSSVVDGLTHWTAFSTRLLPLLPQWIRAILEGSQWVASSREIMLALFSNTDVFHHQQTVLVSCWK